MIKKYQTNHIKEHQKQSYCPTCNRYKKFNERYPDYICGKCVKLATDKSGKQISFYNITTSGHGCQGKYVEDVKLYKGNICYINGIKCFAEEAYFVGIVIRPFKRSRNDEKLDDAANNAEV